MPGARAAAQEQEADQEARSLFEAGRTAYGAGRYDAALRYFEEAYELSRRSALLFNLGSTLERLQRNERAIEMYRQYLEEQPEAENRAFCERRIRFLEAVLRGENPTDEPEVATPREAAQTVLDSEGRPIDAPRSTDLASEPWFWTVLALAVLAVAGGITAAIVVTQSGVEAPIDGDFGTVMALEGR